MYMGLDDIGNAAPSIEGRDKLVKRLIRLFRTLQEP